MSGTHTSARHILNAHIHIHTHTHTHEESKARTQEDATLLPMASPAMNMEFFKILGSPEGCFTPQFWVFS